ncbi:MAG: hypothetical protein ACFCU6_09930 [Balneolaceae bacterium]
MYKKQTGLIFSLVLFPSLIYCQQDNYKNYISLDEKFSLNVPAEWYDLELNDEAIIQVGNEVLEQYLILLSDEKIDLYGWNLQKHSYMTFSQIISNLQDPIINGPKYFKINNYDSVQHEVEGAFENFKVVYIHTVIETEDSFSQILTWTLKSKFSSNEEVFRNVIASFRNKDK